MGKAARRRYQVLVADDDDEAREFLAEALAEAGCDVARAADGREAFRTATRDDFDLIVMDLQMPDWDGLEAIRALDLTRRGTKVLVLSGYLDPGTIATLENQPSVVRWLRKPIDLDELIHVVRGILRGNA